MKNVKKLILATAVMAFAFSGGILATNQVSANADPTVLAALVMDNSGMAIRTKNPEGLRFGATLEMNDEQMTAANIVGTGMILMPADKVDGALEYGETNADGTEALDIPTEVYYEETNSSKSYYSVLVDTDKDGEFPADFYNVPISARAYVKYQDGTYQYSETTVTRSIAYVATMHYLDGNKGDTEGVITKIANSAQKEIEINGGNQLSVEETNGYQATVKFGNYDLQLIENMSVAWSVEGDAVSVDNNGKVTALKGGTATVKAEISVAGGNSVTLTKEVSVADVSYAVKTVYEYEKFTAVKDGARVKNTENFVIDLASAKTADGKSVYLPTGSYTAKLVNNSKTVDLEYVSVSDNKVTWAAGEVTADRYDSTAKVTWSSFVGGEWNLTLTTEGLDATVPVLLVNKVIATADDLLALQTYADNMASYGVQPWNNGTSVTTVQYSGYFKLGGNIQLDSTVLGFVSTFDYAGKYPNAGFIGTFDGCGYTISGGNYDVGGLFGYVGQAGVVKNVAFVDVTFVYSGDDHWNKSEGGSSVVATCFNGTAENVLIDVKDHANSWYAGVFGTSAQLARYKNVVVYYPTRTGSGIDTAGKYFAADAFYGEKATAENFYIFTNEIVDCTSAKKYAITAKLSETDIATAGFDSTIWDLSGDKAAFVKKNA